jgi:molybdate transport system ATP-binding protein
MILLARAMAKNPLILILDEPCIGLDEGNKKLFLGLIDRIAAETQTHILFVSHVADERPSCINQHLQFVPHANGGYTADVTLL